MDISKSKINDSIIYIHKITDINTFRTLSKEEFRITELKAAMRFWWRAFQMNDRDMLIHENQLFGGKVDSTGKVHIKSPIHLRLMENENEKGSYLYRLKLEVVNRTKEAEQFDYFALLHLVSYLGGIGRNTKKSKGCFSVSKQRCVVYPNTQKELIDEIKKLIDACFHLSIQNSVSENNHINLIINNDHNIAEYTIHKICIFNEMPAYWLPIAIKNSGIKKISEKRIYISCYKSKRGNVFPIVTLFGEKDGVVSKAFKQLKLR